MFFFCTKILLQFNHFYHGAKCVMTAYKQWVSSFFFCITMSSVKKIKTSGNKMKRKGRN